MPVNIFDGSKNGWKISVYDVEYDEPSDKFGVKLFDGNNEWTFDDMIIGVEDSLVFFV